MNHSREKTINDIPSKGTGETIGFMVGFAMVVYFFIKNIGAYSDIEPTVSTEVMMILSAIAGTLLTMKLAFFVFEEISRYMEYRKKGYHKKKYGYTVSVIGNPWFWSAVVLVSLVHSAFERSNIMNTFDKTQIPGTSFIADYMITYPLSFSKVFLIAFFGLNLYICLHNLTFEWKIWDKTNFTITNKFKKMTKALITLNKNWYIVSYVWVLIVGSSFSFLFLPSSSVFYVVIASLSVNTFGVILQYIKLHKEEKVTEKQARYENEKQNFFEKINELKSENSIDQEQEVETLLKNQSTVEPEIEKGITNLHVVLRKIGEYYDYLNLEEKHLIARIKESEIEQLINNYNRIPSNKKDDYKKECIEKIATLINEATDLYEELVRRQVKSFKRSVHIIEERYEKG